MRCRGNVGGRSAERPKGLHREAEVDRSSVPLWEAAVGVDLDAVFEQALDQGFGRVAAEIGGRGRIFDRPSVGPVELKPVAGEMGWLGSVVRSEPLTGAR